jgi:hypothetical protein
MLRNLEFLGRGASSLCKDARRVLGELSPKLSEYDLEKRLADKKFYDEKSGSHSVRRKTNHIYDRMLDMSD